MIRVAEELGRRALAALGSVREVVELCVAVGGGTAAELSRLPRAALHARILGMDVDAFERLGEQPSAEAEAEQEAFWQADADE